MLALFLLLQAIPAQAWGFRPEMNRSARQVFGPEVPTAVLAAQLHQESGWKVGAVSRVGAAGLAQFMPITAQDMARRHPSACKPANPFSPTWAIRCRDRYLAELVRALRPMQRAELPECSRWGFALRGYNGGPRWIERDRREAMRQGLDPDYWLDVRRVNSGRSAANFEENTGYSIRIYRLGWRYETAGWGPTLVC